MVRETRHLWVGNLPDNIREDRIREHFKRYGRVQNVKLLGRTESASAGVGANGASGICATVAFMDIKSASKAHNTEHVLEERTLTTEYYEPAAIPPTAGAPSAGSSPAGSGYSGSSSSVNSVPAPSTAPRYHLSGGEDSSGATTCPIAASAAAPANWRGTNDSATEYCRRGNTPATYGRYQRNNTTAPLSTPPSNVERTTPHNRWYASSERAGATGGESTPSTPGEGTESGRRRRTSGSASSRSDSSSPEPSDTSRASTPPTQPPLSHHNNHRTPTSIPGQWASTASGRPLAICVRNLPTRSTDSSLKDGLYHEYKKHGKVVWVKVVGQNADRYAVVRFKKPSDVEKALEVSQDKLFFGCKISVAPHQSGDDDAESAKPYETDIDEYHPKATRTLFIGNLEKDVTQQQLREKFKHFGRIIEIDIKKGSGGGAGYAFCQYASISSVVEAIRAMDGEYVGGSRVKLGFGKPVATACVWVDGLTEHTEKQVLGAVSRSGAATSVCVDRAAGAALVHFEQAADAGSAVRELRRVAGAASAAEPDLPRLCVDYASRECQDAFYEQLEKHGGSAALAGSERLSSELTGRYLPSTRHDSLRFEGSRSRASSFGRSCSRTPRYSAAEPYDPVDYAADRRYRVYDEPGTSPPPDDAVPFEDRLQSVVASPHRARRHRRDSSNEERRHSKERVVSGPRPPVRGGRERQRARRRRRHRREGSGSRAGTPLRDELDAPPAEPRRPPRDRPALPMCLPLPKFAAQIPRAAPPVPRPAPPPPAPAPDSPPRPPSASSSSAGSAPHSPSLEERIRSLDEKYEKWSGSRVQPEAPDRARLRHRLLEVDINEVKPSEVVLSLLAKRSVFDEDSERLEVSARAPSPPGTPGTPRSRSSAAHSGRASTPAHAPDFEVDPRLRRLDRYARTESTSIEYLESRGRPRTPSTDRSQQVSCERRSPSTFIDADLESRSRDSASVTYDAESKSSFDTDEKDTGPETRRERSNSLASDSLLTIKSECLENIPMPLSKSGSDGNNDEDKRSDGLRTIRSSEHVYSDESCARDVMDMILKKVENGQKFDATFETTRKLSKYEFRKDNDLSKIALDRENKLKNMEKSKNLDCTKNPLFDLNSGIKELIEHELQNHINESLTAQSIENELLNHINESIITAKPSKCKSDNNHSSNVKLNEKDKSSQSPPIFRKTQSEKENIQIEKPLDKGNLTSSILTTVDILSTANKSQNQETEKNIEDRMRNDRDKARHSKSKDKHDSEKEKSKNNRNEKGLVKVDKDKKIKEENPATDKHNIDKGDNAKNMDKNVKEKSERDSDKARHSDDKPRHMHHRRDSKSEKDNSAHTKAKKEDKHKPEKNKKENESKRDSKKESETVKSRKSSRDESTKDISRKDSTDSSTSKTSHEVKVKELDVHDFKEDMKPKVKLTDLFVSLEKNRGFLVNKDGVTKIKQENDKIVTCNDTHIKTEHIKSKTDVIDKQRHHSVDSPTVESKRKERLNSCSSLPSNIGIKRRISSQENFDLLSDESKRIKNEPKVPERRESKDSRSGDRHKTTKFSKGHFAKIIESKTKDDKKNQVKPPDDSFGEARDCKDEPMPINRPIKQSPKEECSDFATNEHNENIHNNLGFLALLELRSSEEDEKQKALRKEMKEKKRIQQLQQIQELQMQQEVELGKIKDDKKIKPDDKKRESAREKRMSTERKSREDKGESSKRKNRKQLQSSDSSDSDEPKKHSIFDIIDDGPTYISMYDKVKARSCKNMQKQEEEKRQEKIKAKFSQLKQSRAKREEKKRSSWDEDSDSDQDVQRKKSSLDSSDDDGSTGSQNTKRDKLQCSSIEFDENKTEDYFSTPHDEDQRNKLSRKNSRTRIMSDTSDDESSKNKSIFMRDVKKLNASDTGSLSTKADNSNNYCDEKITKNSLFNLFGKSDSDDSKLKSSLGNENNYRSNIKSFCNDLSSECESVSSNRNADVRRKHKKKQKKYKTSYSDEDNKIETSDTGALDSEIKHKKLIKQRRHSSKKDKRKERIRDSNDTDEGRDDKIKLKRDKKSPDNTHNDYGSDLVTTNTKRDGKMEDIFGPLSDESDIDSKNLNNKSDFSSLDYDSNIGMSEMTTNSNEKDMRRKKDKRRKEKRWFRDDDNSLDVDAVGKAIEANLLTITDDTETVRSGTELKFVDGNMVKDIKANSKYVKLRRDSKEKRKKKKRSREERLGRKDHHYLYHPDSLDKSDHDMLDTPLIDAVSNAMLLDIPLPNDVHAVDDKTHDCKSLSQSPSLPRLTESPPILIESSQDASMDVKSTISISSNSLLNVLSGDDNSEFVVDGKDIEIEQIPMPPPFENIVQDISEVPLPADPAPATINDDKLEALQSTLTSDSDTSEELVLNISSNENETETIVEKLVEKLDTSTSKADKKPDEKPRAIISQEETEDAVAALLGESFGGKVDTFSSYEETEISTTHQTDIENTTLSNENVPEEDAEEMRQAIQNLNACEMEMKPDTPVSDNDLLLIDTDTEEADETPQDAVEKAPANVTINQVLNNNSEPEKSVEEVNTDAASQKQKIEKLPVVLDHVKTTQSETNIKNIETDVKIKLARRENVQVITSTATPVITSWTLTNNRIQEPQHLLNIQSNMMSNKIRTENKAGHNMTTNIVQIKTSQPQNVPVNNLVRPVMAQYVRPPYQVVNQRPQSSHIMQPRVQSPHMPPRALSSSMHPRAQTSYNMPPRPQPSNMQPRPQVSNMQPPTIKIPESHILYQKSPQGGIVISPRISSDPRLQSPKTSPQAEGMTSPRLANMNILTSTPPNFNSAGILSPTSKLQRSPGQVTVVRMQQPPVRMQQPPLSPIQPLHGAHGPRAMMSPNRPNSVLVQRSPIHFNRLPVTPILTPISKQINVNTTILQNKSVGVATMPLIPQHKNLTGGKGDHGSIVGANKNENAKIILSPPSLQHSNNPTVMAQNRLITMQNALHIGSMNSTLLGNKVVVSKMNPLPEKRDNNQMPKTMDHVNHSPFGTSPFIHVAVSHPSSPSIIQSGAKSVMSNIQETNIVTRVQQGPNVIHTLNSQRLMSPVSKNNVIHIDKSKITPSVLSMATMRPATVLAKLETPGITSAGTPTHNNASPILLQSISNIRINTKTDKDHIILDPLHSSVNETKLVEKIDPIPVKKPVTEQCSLLPSLQKSNSQENISKCETDFEELLRDTTNEIKVSNSPEMKLEVNVGKATIPITSDLQTVSEKQIVKTPERDSSKSAQDVSSSDRAISDLHCSSGKDDNNSANEFTRNMIQNNTNTCKNSIPVLPLANSNDMAMKSSEAPDIGQEVENPSTHIVSKLVSSTEKVPKLKEEMKTFDFMKDDNTEESKTEIVKLLDDIDTQLRMNIDDDTWSVKDLNIESVIKKVDSLCNDPIDLQTNEEGIKTDCLTEITTSKVTDASSNKSFLEHVATETTDNNIEKGDDDQSIDKKNSVTGKRGGRSVRGKRGQKVQERVQTRQISRPSRGTTAKRGRGRAKTDKSIKNSNNTVSTAIPGDVYDFHEDSGDETSKTETRPRLILTIKSPLSGQVGVTATSTLSISQKDQNKIAEKLNKEERNEDFVSPSTNTRKSRRLQEKDVHRNVTDEVGEDGAVGPGLGRSAKRKPTKQTFVGKVTNANDKQIAADTRKSPRGNKRTRDRSLSDASVESADGDSRKDEAIRDPKVGRFEERLTQSETDSMAVARPATLLNVLQTAPQATHVSPLPITAPAATASLLAPPVTPTAAPLAAPSAAPPVAPPVALPTPPVITPPVISMAPIPVLPAIPTPITKPPKKMISEISAKLASAFEAGAQHLASPEPARDGSPAAPATGDALAGVARRPMDCMPAAMMPVGATEATDERVQSPALPHRVRVAGRATPILIRVGEGEACANAGIGALGAAGGGGAGGAGAARYRALGGGCGAASLPRGAHHPPPEPHVPAPALTPTLTPTPTLAPGALPLHHHHPGPVSRITSIPAISPQGQMPLSADLARSPPPAHQQTSPITASDGMYPHFSHQHYQMYQHHFRATQHESRATHSPFTRSLEAEGSEAPQPPPELRRPPGARVPRPAHSPSTADRLIMYGRSPPPAHTSGVARVTGALPPVAAPGPPHASQVPREADSLQMLLRRYPVMWQGLLALKNDSAAVQMHFVGGSPDVAGDTLARADAGTPMLRIAQRMRLETTQLEGVHRKMMMENEHCILLALPCGRDHMDVLLQSTNLSNGFITYLQHKQAAGIVNIAPPGHQQAMFTVHVFPSCDFANENLTRIAPDLMHRVADIAHLLIVIATV